jgi:hypothetical protein
LEAITLIVSTAVAPIGKELQSALPIVRVLTVLEAKNSLCFAIIKHDPH